MTKNNKLIIKPKMMINRFDASHETFTRLKFIGKIQIGDKINTRNYLSIMEDGWMTSILRRFYSFENRLDSHSFISQTINNTLYIIERLFQGRNPSHSSLNDEIVLENLLKDLKLSIHGLRNLIQTYADDLAFTCRMETIIQNIELCLRKIETDDIENSSIIQQTTL